MATFSTFYNPDGILGRLDLLNATVSKLFVDMKKGTVGKPHAELRLVLVGNKTGKWNCSIGSNPGAAVNNGSACDITFSVQDCADTPAGILISFEFQVLTTYMTFRHFVNYLRGINSTKLPEYLSKFHCLGLRGSRDVVVQWVMRFYRLEVIDLRARAVVMPPGRSLLREPQLDFAKFIAKDYTESSLDVIQTTQDIPIHRGWFYSKQDRATGSRDGTIPYLPILEDDDYFNFKASASSMDKGNVAHN